MTPGMRTPASEMMKMLLPPHPFDPLSAPRGGLERVRKILCFPCHLVAAELHDAHGVGRLPVIRQNVLGNPKITAAKDSPHGEALFARLIGACDLYVAPAADSLARLGVFQHRILEIDVVLRFKIVGIGCSPMPIQCRTYLLIYHMTSGVAELTLPSAELIAETQTDGARTIHRYGFVPLRVVRIEFGPRVGQILSVDLHEPRVLSATDRPFISCESGQVISSGVALRVGQLIGRRDGA